MSTNLKVMSNKVHKNRLKTLNVMWQLMLNINFPSMPVVIRFRILYLPLCCYENVKLKTYQTIILYFAF